MPEDVETSRLGPADKSWLLLSAEPTTPLLLLNEDIVTELVIGLSLLDCWPGCVNCAAIVRWEARELLCLDLEWFRLPCREEEEEEGGLGGGCGWSRWEWEGEDTDELLVGGVYQALLVDEGSCMDGWVKDLWCSSTVWLLSTQMWMNVKAPSILG